MLSLQPCNPAFVLLTHGLGVSEFCTQAVWPAHLGHFCRS